MLLKVRLPSSIPPIPKMSLSMTDVDLTLSALPSSSTILLSMVAVFVLLSFVRALFIGLREHLAFVRTRKANNNTSFVSVSTTAPAPSSTTSTSSPSEKASTGTAAVAPPRPRSSWLWGLVKWDTLPAFPVDVTTAASPRAHLAIGSGAGVMGEKWPQMQQANARRAPVVRGPGPAFERPLPTLYQSDMPVSMAKMIMSRHRPAIRSLSVRLSIPALHCPHSSDPQFRSFEHRRTGAYDLVIAFVPQPSYSPYSVSSHHDLP
ncbi:hypothetical protein DFP72DRAFT_1050974 [Ephemerocybe angulata]|uniref:Uncharacterized protein n=1 Tax=Ephemerocybe angulata TaxID=980116 RepID=A0A8H6HFD3_9AGAR|nr:hypothetical protein DFP72DRAFT_1050974 [Tulosesus angulatus]